MYRKALKELLQMLAENLCVKPYLNMSYENSSDDFDIGHILSDRGQGHSMTLKFFFIYHNTNCQVLYLNFGTFYEVGNTYVC